MKRRKLLAVALCVVMGISMLTGCGNDDKENSTEDTSQAEQDSGSDESSQAESAEETSDGQESESGEMTGELSDMLKDSYFAYGYEAADMKITFYLHFYDEVPGLGDVFYAGMCMNQMNFVGTYSVEEAEYVYNCYMAYGDEEMATGTVPYTITFYDWNGAVIDTCGFDGDTVYSDMETITGPGGSNILMVRTDAEDEEWASTFEAEVGTAYLTLDNETATAPITLYHDGTYNDAAGSMAVEGTWGIDSADENGTVFKLTPQDETDAGATITLAADKVNATYVSDDGTEVALTNQSVTAELYSHMEGSTPIAGVEDVEAVLNLNLYTDASCELIADVFGTTAVLDKGTYAIGEDGFTLNFVFDNAGELSSTIDFDTAVISLEYILNGSDIGDVDSVLTLINE